MGKIDINSSPVLKKTFSGQLESEKSPIAVDMDSVSYLSSAEIRMLLEMHKKAEKANVYVTINRPSKQVQEVFKMTGLTGVMKIE